MDIAIVIIDCHCQVASIIFLDLPANTGFSYTKFPDPEGTQRSDSKQILHGLQFLRKVLYSWDSHTTTAITTTLVIVFFFSG